jgi:pre-mRNA-splicing factor CWC26
MRHDSDSDQSPPRKGRHKPDQSVPQKRHNSDSDQSVDRRQNSDSDLSPQRREPETDSDQSPPRRGRHNSSEKSAKMNKTLSGKKAGLSSAKDMKREADILKKKEDETFKKVK